MTARCGVCSSEHRAEIEDCLIQGLTFRTIAARYQVPRQSIHNHKQDHMPAELLRAWQAERRLSEVLDVPARMHEEWLLTEVLLDHATDPLSTGRRSLDGVDKGFVIQLLRLRFKYFDILLRVLGALPEPQVVNPMMVPAFRDFLGRLDALIGDDLELRIRLSTLLAPDVRRHGDSGEDEQPTALTQD